MGIQELLSMWSAMEMRKRVASGQNISLGGLIEALEAMPQEARPVFDYGKFPAHVGSYRGYYSDLSIVPNPLPGYETVSALLSALRGAVGAIFEGYKGGEFTMDGSTPIWSSPYGESNGLAVVGVEEREGTVTLITQTIAD